MKKTHVYNLKYKSSCLETDSADLGTVEKDGSGLFGKLLKYLMKITKKLIFVILKIAII